MKLISWNVNGLRACLGKGFTDYFAQHDADFFCLQEVARLIAECYANRDKADITFLVVEAKKSNLETQPTALIFLEA